VTGIEGVSAIGGLGTDPVISRLGVTASAPAAVQPSQVPQVSQASFTEVLADGMRAMDAKVSAANDLVRQFAIDDSVPLHKVTYALEEARLSVELAMQIRGRLVESYRELMNMQL
jgi:flagellar hook-basal body complex protein FliE